MGQKGLTSVWRTFERSVNVQALRWRVSLHARPGVRLAPAVATV